MGTKHKTKAVCVCNFMKSSSIYTAQNGAFKDLMMQMIF